ncbi:LANO_0G04478g1_1 [Lachancea nothofagi CBS 11611]|uniref:LANO_0G04478g1_1 n=1 Tax=Lachancea nothofagi CBS 11611 TaxID=1266666 RepID=A0A1G4KGG1_9SACH|nr:LANO_0G04478g1_1 [Lachancea nothofagi CBS 11611]
MKPITTPKIPFNASKGNVFSNIAINSLFGLGIYFLYKGHQNKDEVVSKQKTREPLPSEHGQISSSPTRVKFSNLTSAFGTELSHMTSTLSYQELSFVTVGFGFMLQLANMAHVSYGRNSLLYKLGVFSVILYPPLTYYMYNSHIQNT